MSERTITKSHLLRLEAQRDEAKTLELVKLAENLDTEIKKQADNTRDDDVFYSYSHEELKKDLVEQLWAAATRVSDYLGSVPDARDIDAIVRTHADNMFRELSIAASIPSGVGVNEPLVPGESRVKLALEVEDSD